jgi:hypothetical protein
MSSGEWPPDQSARLDHEPDANGRNLAVIAITVRSRDSNRSSPRREHMLIKTERQFQLAANEVGVLGPLCRISRPSVEEALPGSYVTSRKSTW